MRKFCLVVSLILMTQKLGKCCLRACLGTKIPHSILVHDLPSIEIGIQHLKLAMQTSMLHKSWTRMECGILDSHTFFSIKTQYHYKIHGLTTNYKLRATNKISASIRKKCLFIVLGYASSIFWVSFCDLSL